MSNLNRIEKRNKHGGSCKKSRHNAKFRVISRTFSYPFAQRRFHLQVDNFQRQEYLPSVAKLKAPASSVKSMRRQTIYFLFSAEQSFTLIGET